MVRLQRFAVIVAALGYATQAAAVENLIANPRFEITAKQGGGPDRWQLGGDSRVVTQALSMEPGREGRHAGSSGGWPSAKGHDATCFAMARD